jgi:hypothetical protein
VLLPERPAPTSGLETIVANLALDAGAAVGRLGRLLTQ